MSSERNEYNSKPIFEILGELATKIYRPPFSALRDDIRSVPEELRISILIIDFDTAIQMNGMLGFLENSTGLYFLDTIDAFEAIGASKTANILRTIRGIMSDCGVTVEQLREDFANCEPNQITSFSKLHGEKTSQMSELVDHEASKLYVYDQSGEAIFDLLETYLENRKDRFIASLAGI
jgi:hypothetical protein